MSGAATPTRIVICDDHPIFLDGLKRLLNGEPGFQVIADATDGDAALRVVQDLHPDILLLDLAMPGLTGLGVLEALRTAALTTRTILLTAAIDKADLVAALQLGARGVVLKQTTTALLFKSIRCVMDGQYWVGQEGVANLVTTLRDLVSEAQEDQAGRKSFGLTKREFEVIGAIVTGSTNREIARQFGISEDTIKHHLTNIFDKLGVSTRLELALFAVQNKLLDKL